MLKIMSMALPTYAVDTIMSELEEVLNVCHAIEMKDALKKWKTSILKLLYLIMLIVDYTYKFLCPFLTVFFQLG